MKYLKILLILVLFPLKSEAVPGSILLAADREIKEQALREHPLYQEGISLALQAAHHRNGLEEQASNAFISSELSLARDRITTSKNLQKEADRVKADIISPLREVFEAPPTPRGTEKAKAFFSGMGESVKDTLELPLVLGKFGITAAQSVIEWEDKLSLKSAYEGVKDLFSEAKQSWEDDAAYQARQQAAREYKAKAQAYEKAFNAAHYHTDQAKTAGYISAEALQFVFGSEIFKAGAQGVKVAGSGAFKTAKSGGKHSGFYKNYLKRNVDEINKAINTLQHGKRGINKHIDKIANPKKYVPDWDIISKPHQESLINGWRQEIANATEQVKILEGILMS